MIVPTLSVTRKLYTSIIWLPFCIGRILAWHFPTKAAHLISVGLALLQSKMVECSALDTVLETSSCPPGNSSVRHELATSHKEDNFTLMHIREADQKNAKIVVGWNRRQEHFDTV
jgi:hypothetical protein